VSDVSLSAELEPQLRPSLSSMDDLDLGLGDLVDNDWDVAPEF
jgi:hypothetical protein